MYALLTCSDCAGLRLSDPHHGSPGMGVGRSAHTIQVLCRDVQNSWPPFLRHDRGVAVFPRVTCLPDRAARPYASAGRRAVIPCDLFSVAVPSDKENAEFQAGDGTKSAGCRGIGDTIHSRTEMPSAGSCCSSEPSELGGEREVESAVTPIEGGGALE